MNGELDPDGGYAEFPNGLTIQWGISHNSGSLGGDWIVFKRPFKTTCTSSVGSMDGSTTNQAEGINTWGCTKIGFMANTFYFPGSLPYPVSGFFSWIAIGY